ncbi:Dynamin-like GTPase that mediates homotypic ER fusion [Podila humilis]|nr:Dynamin-like GTPase that mediates homotypic ER fusion [Podila humilis]
MEQLVPDIDNDSSAVVEPTTTDAGGDHLPQLHLIDEEKKFSDQLSTYIDQKWGLKDTGFNYHIAAVFGSQSTGKSTLLNRLFGTHFDVMNETARMQTTKGIWISKGQDMDVLVMDVEGTDGRERGEDQDFERKSALFSVATSEVLIVNMWEHQVGLYNGANMGLLKTVFEVNLQLFGNRKGKEKTLLLFVIRDHVGSTPLANLSNTLRSDLDKIWQGLPKPEGLQDCKITDYFDFMFTTLPHKLLQPDQFESEVEQLRTRFTDSSPKNPYYVFQPQYSKRVPIDGFQFYASAIWDKIMTNKDLDLPTQQELLAQFRCDEIADAAFAVFKDSIKGFRHPIESGHIVEDLGPQMKEMRATALKSFDKDASRYHAEVYKRKRIEVLTKANTMLESLRLGQMKNLHKKAISLFSTQLQQELNRKRKLSGDNDDDGNDDGANTEFSKASTKARNDAMTYFTTAAKQIQLEDTDWGFEEESLQLAQDLQELTAIQREKEWNKILVGLEKQMKQSMEEPIKLALDRPSAGMWGKVITCYKHTIQGAEATLSKGAKMFDLSEGELQHQKEKLRRQGWILATTKVREETVDGLMVYRLLNQFEEKFQRDDHGLPRVWRPSDDIDTPFRHARNETISYIPLYSKINPLDPATGEPFRLESKTAMTTTTTMGGKKPETDASSSSFEEDDDFDFDQSLKIISESRQQVLMNELKRKADASYVEAKRSVVATQAKIPYWVGVALVLLGWNEFVTVITNPLYLTFTVIVGIPLLALWYLGMLGIVQTIGQKVYDQGLQLGTAQLRQHFGAEEQQQQQQERQRQRQRQRQQQGQLRHQGAVPLAVPANAGNSHDEPGPSSQSLHNHHHQKSKSHLLHERRDDNSTLAFEMKSLSENKKTL